ncbi:MAG: HAD family phosphatase [Proteobacteria bacterium]|nr:HAD family phosphatase [Pseudomonadota bacterium]
MDIKNFSILLFFAMFITTFQINALDDSEQKDKNRRSFSSHNDEQANQHSDIEMTTTSKIYTAFIFDCDGILVDTEYLKYLAWKKAFETFQISFEEEDYLPLVGYSSQEIAQKFQEKAMKEFVIEDVIKIKEAEYRCLQDKKVPLFKDALVFLRKIIALKREKNIKVAIASSAPHEEIHRNLKAMGLFPETFDLIISGHDDLSHIKDPTGVNKPKPYIYTLCSEKLNVTPEECVVFEDTHAGVMAALTAGLDVIAVPNRFTASHDFRKALKATPFNQIELLETPSGISLRL